MEPTANATRTRMPRQPQRGGDAFEGEAAHTARPVARPERDPRGDRRARADADLPVRDIEVDGLVFREVRQRDRDRGRYRRQRRAGSCGRAHVNFRYAPTHTPDEAEREAAGAPRSSERCRGDPSATRRPARSPSANPLVERLRTAGRSRRRPQAGLDAGRGVRPRRGRRRELRTRRPAVRSPGRRAVEVAALVRSYEVLRAFLRGGKT